MMTNKRLFSGFSLLPAAALFLVAACTSPSDSPDPQVVSVTLDPVTATIPRGDVTVFTATVEVLGGASPEVTWEVTGEDGAGAGMDHHPDTGITPGPGETNTAALYVGADETAAVLIVTVTSKEDTNLHAIARVTLNSGPFVSDVIIEDGEVINLNQGRTYTLQAAAAGPGLTEEEKNHVIWTIESDHTEGTSIGADGVLTIAGDEPTGVLIIRAASGKNPARFTEISVVVLDKNAPAVVSIIVGVAGNASSVGPGGTLQFSAEVTVENDASNAVAWTLTGNDKPGTAIDATTGVLTVAADETADSLTITASSTVEGFTNIKNSVTVSVAIGDVYLIGEDFGGWEIGAAGRRQGTKAGKVFSWNSVPMNAGTTFKFHDDTVTGWDNGTWYVADGDKVSTEGTGPKPVIKTNASGIDNAWQTAATGTYTITLDTAALTVTFTPIPEVTAITVTGPTVVGKGSTHTYTAEVTATHGATTVTWSLTGGKSGTTISTAGVLTVAADETGPLTITAASTVTPSVQGSLPVTISKGDIYLIGNDFPGGWGTPSATSGQVMTKGGVNSFTWTGMMYQNSTFKFHDDTVTGWDNGTWYVADGDKVSTEGTGPKPVIKTNASGIDNAWQTAATGTYAITLDTAVPTVVTFTPIPEVTTVTAITGPERVGLNGTGDFTATVTATHGATVTWSLSGNDKAGTTLVPNVLDENKATLTVASDETAASLTIRAESPTDTTQFKEKTVAVGFGDIYLIGEDFGGWGTPSATSGQVMTKGLNGSYTWSGTMKKGSTFKFHDDTITGFSDGSWFNAPNINQATTDDTHGVGITDGSDAGKDWKTSHGGEYTITLDTVASTVTFTSTPQTVAIINLVEGLAPGETHTFDTILTGVTLPDTGAAVTWTVTGGGISDGTSPTGTAITATGLLTLGSGEWITHTLTITATTALNETNSTTVKVIDAKVWLVGAMNSWDNNPGTEMTRTEASFTWTGTINGGDYFRFAVDNQNSWDRQWLLPTGTDAINKSYWITTSNLSSLLPVDRFDEPKSSEDRNWFLADTGPDTPGSGTYTLTYNAVTGQLTVVKD